MKLPVFIHRWFASGAGWAYGPDGAGDLPEVAQALEPLLNKWDRSSPLQSIQERTGRGSWIIGALEDDPDTPDPLARARGASVARVVLIPSEIPEEAFPQIRDQVRKTPLPQTPGRHDELLVSCDLSVPRRKTEAARGHKGVWLAVVAGIIVVWLAISHRPSTPPDALPLSSTVPTTVRPPVRDEVLDASLRAQAHLCRWNVASPESPSAAAVFDAFFKTLSRESVPDGDLASDNRMTDFVKRLPKLRVSAGLGRMKLEDARKLRKLLMRLALDVRGQPRDEPSLAGLVDWIAEAMDPDWYDEEYRRHGRRRRGKPTKAVRDLAARFGFRPDTDLAEPLGGEQSIIQTPSTAPDEQ